MTEKRIQVAIPESAHKELEILAAKMDTTKGRAAKIAIDAFAKKVSK